MKKLLLASGLFCLLSLPFTTAQSTITNQYYLKIKASNKFERSAVANTGVTIEEIQKDFVVAYGTAEEKAQLEKMGLIIDAKALGAGFAGLDFPAEDSDYHNYAETTDELNKLAQEFPGITKLFSIGKSFEGRDIMGIRICGDMANASQKAAVAFMGGHHSREHLSVEMPLRLARFLLEKYKAGNDRIVHLVNSRDIQIVPAVNPDGLEFDISTGQYQMWRKNRRTNRDGTYGVDLNRNYGFKWGTGGSSTSTTSEVYMGPSAFSEPETQAVKNWIETNKNISTLLTYHTYSELILYPWGHKYESISEKRDLAVYETMAKKMAEWNHYTPQQSSALYIASGDTTDWAYGEHKVISFTFELDPQNAWGGGGFYPGAQVIPEVIAKNIEPALYLMEYADNPYRVLSPNLSNEMFHQ